MRPNRADVAIKALESANYDQTGEEIRRMTHSELREFAFYLLGRVEGLR